MNPLERAIAIAAAEVANQAVPVGEDAAIMVVPSIPMVRLKALLEVAGYVDGKP